MSNGDGRAKVTLSLSCETGEAAFLLAIYAVMCDRSLDCLDPNFDAFPRAVNYLAMMAEEVYTGRTMTELSGEDAGVIRRFLDAA